MVGEVAGINPVQDMALDRNLAIVFEARLAYWH